MRADRNSPHFHMAPLWECADADCAGEIETETPVEAVGLLGAVAHVHRLRPRSLGRAATESCRRV